ncbi:MAG TPA: hypothetical protein VE377_04365 [Candidatus Dormibacteraeota bacterium]|nr:hypothetical protein [Candidatus Dormibacteraeota bacterium]
MLTIRPEQLDTLSRHAQAAFDGKLKAYLQVALPPEALARLDHTLPQALDLARQAGIVSEQHVARFAATACALSGGPADLPRQALANLHAYGKDPAAKLDALEEFAKSNGHPPATPPSQFGANPPGTAVHPCSPQNQVVTYWLEIELIGEDDLPIPWARYSVALPNGETTTGYLDGDGYARFEQLPAAGTCQVTFPELDKDAITFIESAGARPSSPP